MRNKKDIKKNVLDIFQKKFKIKKKIYKYDEIVSWDSLAHMSLITSIEKKFKIIIENNDMPKLLSSDLFINYINVRKKT
tara:strand:+ start:1183 stop:1419 length:237 start_codon:yes stop_codon:yes gene_type:complete